MSRDPAWKWAEKVPGPKAHLSYTKCKFCGVVVPSGITRMKNHLAGNHQETKPCDKVPTEVRVEVKAMLEKAIKKKVAGQRNASETVSLGSNWESLHAGVETPPESASDRSVRGPMQHYYPPITPGSTAGSTPTSSTLPPVSERAKAARQDIARYFYENCIAFNTASSPAFIGMVRSIGLFGPGLMVPTAYDISSPMLLNEVKSTDVIVEEVKRTWPHSGVTIISDGWKDIRGRQLLNFLVNNPHGTVFLRTIDASNAVKTGDMLFKLLDAVVEEVGEKNVVQIITDNASNYVLAGKLLMEKRKHLYWTPCAAHCIDLMLEKIGELPQHKTALRKAKKVYVFKVIPIQSFG
jgi:hypothetical protein